MCSVGYFFPQLLSLRQPNRLSGFDSSSGDSEYVGILLLIAEFTIVSRAEYFSGYNFTNTNPRK